VAYPVLEAAGEMPAVEIAESDPITLAASKSTLLTISLQQLFAASRVLFTTDATSIRRPPFPQLEAPVRSGQPFSVPHTSTVRFCRGCIPT